MRIGIFGGSFNPIHSGHAILANYVLQNCDLDELWLMVSPQNPLKPNFDESLDAHRMNMANLVCRELPGLVASDFEFSMPRPSYTIDTLRQLSKIHPEHSFTLLIGADNWAVFNRWKDYEEILKNYAVMVYPRRGYDIDKSLLPPTVTLIDAPIIELSSTEIRETVNGGNAITFMVPQCVEQYIKTHNLYKLK